MANLSLQTQNQGKYIYYNEIMYIVLLLFALQVSICS